MSITALYAGSFDPPTKGHEDIIVKASKMFDKLYVVIAVNEGKRPYFDSLTRKAYLEQIVEYNKLKNVEVLYHRGLTVHIAHELKANVLVRGIRNATDLEYEKQLAYVNLQIDPELNTVFINTDPKFTLVSSTAVRGFIKMFEDHAIDKNVYNAMISNYISQANIKNFLKLILTSGKVQFESKYLFGVYNSIINNTLKK